MSLSHVALLIHLKYIDQIIIGIVTSAIHCNPLCAAWLLLATLANAAGIFWPVGTSWFRPRTAMEKGKGDACRLVSPISSFKEP